MVRACRLVAALAAAMAMAAAFASLAMGARPAGDIVFVVDGSSSMRAELNSIRDRVDQIVSELESRLDARFALVAFGGSIPEAPNGEPRAMSSLADAASFQHALGEFQSAPRSGGSNEPGLDAVRFAMSELPGFRAGAGTCAIVFTDESPSFVADQSTDLSRALLALNARDGVFFGVTKPGHPVTGATYGPEAGSLAEVTGGAIFELDEFATDPSAVLDALLKACGRAVEQHASAAAFGAVPTSGLAPLSVSFSGTADPSTTSYSWDFGDGSKSQGRNATHTFEGAGTFRVVLTAKGPAGEATATLDIEARASGPRVVKASDCTIVGTAASDRLVGTPGDDVICGFAGDDVLLGRAGNDALAGGLDDDRLLAGKGRDWLSGQLGRDTLIGGRGRDILLGARGPDRLNGGPGNDKLRGGRGSDHLVGNRGSDILIGGFGRDILIGSAGRDTLRGGRGNDDLLALDGKVDTVDGGPGRDHGWLDARDQARRLFRSFT